MFQDYTDGKLDELIDVVIESKARLFVSAVGVPPKHVVEKLHAAGIAVMNMIGSPKHVKKALAVGVDIICAQGLFRFHSLFRGRSRSDRVSFFSP
jgi:NAD(P)H-dependent flavin oxidoreductase YrpB (nitropropane dioxygenase family)